MREEESSLVTDSTWSQEQHICASTARTAHPPHSAHCTAQPRSWSIWNPAQGIKQHGRHSRAVIFGWKERYTVQPMQGIKKLECCPIIESNIASVFLISAFGCKRKRDRIAFYAWGRLSIPRIAGTLRKGQTLRFLWREQTDIWDIVLWNIVMHCFYEVGQCILALHGSKCILDCNDALNKCSLWHTGVHTFSIATYSYQEGFCILRGVMLVGLSSRKKACPGCISWI